MKCQQESSVLPNELSLQWHDSSWYISPASLVLNFIYIYLVILFGLFIDYICEPSENTFGLLKSYMPVKGRLAAIQFKHCNLNRN